MGNNIRPISIVGKDHVHARDSLQPAFQEVLVLKPPASLFPWTKVSKLPIGTKKALHSTTFSKIPKNLTEAIRSLEGSAWAEFFLVAVEKNLTPPSTKDNLLVVFGVLRATILEHMTADKRVHK